MRTVCTNLLSCRFFIAYLLGMYYHIRFLANVSIQLAALHCSVCKYIQCSFASSTSSYSHTLIVYFFYYDAMTEERLEIGKYSNLSSSYHLLLCAVYEMERNESMYKVCTYVFVSHCVPFRESKAKKK